MPATRAASRAGKTVRVTRSNSASHGAGRSTTTSATTNIAPNSSAARPARRDTGVSSRVECAGNEGDAMASAIRPSITRASNTRSTPMEPSAVVNRTGN